MKFLTTLCLVLLFISYIQCGLEYQVGHDSSVEAGSSLSTSQETPRYEVFRVEFEEAFSSAPQIVLSIEQINFEQGPGSEFKVRVVDSDTAGFSYEVFVDFPQAFNSLTVHYFAYLDPHLVSETYQYKTFGINGESDKQDALFEINFDREYVEPPKVLTFLLGGSFNEANNSIDVDISAVNVTTTGCNVEVRAFEDGNPYSVFFQAVIIPSDRTDSLRLGSEENADLALTDEDGYSVEAFSCELNGDVMFYGLSGFRSQSQEGGVVDVSVEVSDGVGTLGGETGETQINKANFEAFGYSPSDDCAFLFLGCNFTGNGISICADAPRNSFVGTHVEQSKIKSIYIPDGQTLTLYDEEDLAGNTATYTETVYCQDFVKADA